ncbi:MAG: hypothetical protein ACTHKU_15555, partial [Verrucomicrobiota bacterium]
PFMSPFLQSITIPTGEFLFGGCGPEINAATPLPEELLEFVTLRTNLVGYGWEITPAKSKQWLYTSQFIRMVMQKSQLSGGSPGLMWFQSATANLRNCATELVNTQPNQLAFARKSSFGFSAIELQILVDWLESPQFPLGLHTFTAQPDASQ